MEEKNEKRKDFINNLKVDIYNYNKKNKMYDEYYTYKNTYKDSYKKHTLLEYLFLKQEFPNTDFDINIRMKSYMSAKNKINKEIGKGRDGTIYDRLAKKYIIYSDNGSKEEKDLIQACYNFRDALLYNFPDYLKYEYPEVEEKNIDFKLKDYIKTPKSTGYQSIHLSKMHSENNNEFSSETQIKTFRMREIEQYGSASHSNIYKNRNNILRESELEKAIPLYMDIDYDKKKHIYMVKEKSFSECFERFFKYPYKEFLENKEKLTASNEIIHNQLGQSIEKDNEITDEAANINNLKLNNNEKNDSLKDKDDYIILNKLFNLQLNNKEELER